MSENDVFSNGEEYRYFIEHFCERCELYSNCFIEENISRAMLDRTLFPNNHVVRLNNTATWVCKSFLGIDKQVHDLFIKQVLPKIEEVE